MRRRIVGAICMIWGGSILLSAFLRGGPLGHGPYGAGEIAGLAFGAVLLIFGLYRFFKTDAPAQ